MLAIVWFFSLCPVWCSSALTTHKSPLSAYELELHRHMSGVIQRKSVMSISFSKMRLNAMEFSTASIRPGYRRSNCNAVSLLFDTIPINLVNAFENCPSKSSCGLLEHNCIRVVDPTAFAYVAYFSSSGLKHWLARFRPCSTFDYSK